MSGNISKKKWGTGEASVNGKTLYTLSVSDIDNFYDGIGIVTEDIFSGNLVTGVKKWLLFASNELIGINYYNVTQTRYYNNYWQKRTGSYYQDVVNSGNWTSAWQPWENIESVDFSEYAKKADTLEGYGINNAYSKDEADKKFLTKDSLEQISSFVTTEELNQKLSSVYKYKGTVADLSKLPENPEIGDVYNIENGNKVEVAVRVFNITRINQYNDVLGSTILYFSNDISDIYSYSSPVDIYDKSLNMIGTLYAIDFYNKYIEVSGNHSSSNMTECYAMFMEQEYNINTLQFGDIDPGDNIAWTGEYWDELAGVVDTTRFAIKAETLKGYGIKDSYTKEEVDMKQINLENRIYDLNGKISSVYRYKGTVSHFSNLPSSPDVGDVYNIENGYHLSKEVKPVTVTDVYTDEDYAYILVDPGTGMPPWAFNIDGINICDKNLNVISVAAITDLDKMRCEKDAAIEIGKQYYLEYFNITPEDLIYETGIVTVSVDINAGDNVAWTGSEWDRLAGTIDLSGYVTREELGNIEAALSRIEELQNGYIAGGE